METDIIFHDVFMRKLVDLALTDLIMDSYWFLLAQQ